MNVALRVCRVNVEKQGKGLEAAARAARYQAFSDGMKKIIVLAHHRNDQIETFMLSAVRGGGLRGMAAMPVWRDLNEEIQICGRFWHFPVRNWQSMRNNGGCLLSRTKVTRILSIYAIG